MCRLVGTDASLHPATRAASQNVPPAATRGVQQPPCCSDLVDMYHLTLSGGSVLCVCTSPFSYLNADVCSVDAEALVHLQRAYLAKAPAGWLCLSADSLAAI